MLNDITLYDEGSFGFPGSEINYVATSAAGSAIKVGEPVAVALGAAVVTALATSKTVVGTDYLVGVAMSTSTETATATGTVQVSKLSIASSYLIVPKVASAWNTQAKYDALVGARVTLDLTASAYTINSTDSTNNGCVVLPLNISIYPGKVRFGFRAGTNYLA